MKLAQHAEGLFQLKLETLYILYILHLLETPLVVPSIKNCRQAIKVCVASWNHKWFINAHHMMFHKSYFLPNSILAIIFQYGHLMHQLGHPTCAWTLKRICLLPDLCHDIKRISRYERHGPPKRDPFCTVSIYDFLI